MGIEFRANTVGPNPWALLANPVERNAERPMGTGEVKTFLGALVQEVWKDETDAPKAVLHGARISFNHEEAGVWPQSEYCAQQEHVPAVTVAHTSICDVNAITEMLPCQWIG